MPTADKQPAVWIRESQKKIIYAHEDMDTAHYTVDILRSSHIAFPSKLSTETIINFAENGVPPGIFQTLIKQNFEDKVTKLTTWDGKDGHYKLWRNICQEGSVITARLARQNVGSARALGYVYEDQEPSLDDNDLVDEEPTSEKSTAWWEDPVSGEPSSLEETCLGLLDAGFSPASCQVLRMKLGYVARKSLTTLTTKYHIRVPMSCTAFVIPG
jgi:RNA-dependent RNA polymerase